MFGWGMKVFEERDLGLDGSGSIGWTDDDDMKRLADENGGGTGNEERG